MQAIYAGKAKQSQLHGFVCFQKFFKSQNPNCWSNETEALKLVDEIINSYVVNKTQAMKLPPT